MKLYQLAWKNIWRNPVRSGIVILAIASGIWALVFLSSFTEGMVKAYIQKAIHFETAHLQIHHPDWQEERLWAQFFEEEEVEKVLTERKGVQALSHRVIAEGMVMAPGMTTGASIIGIDPNQDAGVRNLKEKLVEGEYFQEDYKLPVVIGEAIAENLGLKLGSKVVLTFPDSSGSITSGAFRVAALFNTQNKKWDEGLVFVKKSDLTRMGGLPSNATHQTGILLEENAGVTVEELQASLSSDLPGLEVSTFRELAPELRLYESSLGINHLIMTAIIMLALVFGIINTMLMAVLERTRELGMLMAIGMKPGQVFRLIALETVVLGCLGMPAGILLGMVTVGVWGARGIDLSAFSDGFSQFGLEPIVYLSLDPINYILFALAVFITALLASIYPSMKATRLRPVEALRKI